MYEVDKSKLIKVLYFRGAGHMYVNNLPRVTVHQCGGCEWNPAQRPIEPHVNRITSFQRSLIKHTCACCSFATTERGGVLFYNGRYNEKHDFMALEIIDGHIEFSFSLGTDVTRVAAFPLAGVELSDGLWHQVTVTYLNRVSCH